MAVFAVFSAVTWSSRGGIMMGFSMLIFGAGTILSTINFLRSGPALSLDARGVSIGKPFGGTNEVPWKDVHSIDMRVVTVRYLGLIPVSRNEILTIACEGGMFGSRKLRLCLKAVQLPAGGGAELVAILRQAHLAAVGIAGVAMAGAGKNGWGAAPDPDQPKRNESFDPDAAIARYLASKEGAAAGDHAPEVPASRPAVPQRPVFGRRVS